MKLCIFLFLLALLLPYGAQLRTRYRPGALAIQRKLWAAPIGRRYSSLDT
jgi:hypothetical protein